MSNSSKSFISYLAGVATGVAIGMLFAPEKGEITRDRLGFRLNKYKEQLQTFIADLIERGDEVISEIGDTDAETEAKAEGRKVVNEARQKAERLLEDVESLMSQIKSKA